LQRTAPQARFDTSYRCLLPKLLDYVHPYSLVPGASPALARRAEATGFGTRRVAGEGESSRDPIPRFGEPHPPRSGLSLTGRGVFFPERPMRPTSDAPVASPAPVFGGRSPRLHVGPPGRELPRPLPHPRVTANGWERPGAPSINRGHFASAGLSLRLGTSALRAAMEPKGSTSCAGVAPLRAWDPRSRWQPPRIDPILRRLFRPRLRLRPRFLGGKEGSTPWTRSPFTSRRPCDRPGPSDR
jgi:hypothetical protein